MLLDVSADEVALACAQGGPALSDALERGRIVRFLTCPIALPPQGDQEFLRGELAARLSRKNVSWHPEGERLVGIKGAPAVAERAQAILRAHSTRASDFLHRAMPGFLRGAHVGTSSFRPLQEKGRHLSAHASNELIHIDAGAYGATHGDRILRFFVNLNPSEDRVWASKGTFKDLYRAHGAQAGLRQGRVQPGPLDKALSGTLRAAARAVPALRMIDTSPYDRLMRRFHNFMKDEPAFRDSAEGQVELRFPPFSSWMVLTDAVSHACLSGQHALVDTLVVPLANCRLREEAPWDILARAS